MAKQIQLSIQQREKGFIDLIKDGEEMGFNKQLLDGYKQQLAEVQGQLKKDKDKVLLFNKTERGLIQNDD